MKIRVPVKVSIPRAGEFLVTIRWESPLATMPGTVARYAESAARARVVAKVTPEGKRTIARALKRAKR